MTKMVSKSEPKTEPKSSKWDPKAIPKEGPKKTKRDLRGVERVRMEPLGLKRPSWFPCVALANPTNPLAPLEALWAPGPPWA